MKSVLQLLCVLFLTSFVFVSCSSDDDGDGGGEGGGLAVNTIEYNGETFKITSAVQYVEPAYEDAKAKSIELSLIIDKDKEMEVWLDMFVPLTEDKLVAGTYTYSSERDWRKVSPMKFNYGEIMLDTDRDIIDGSVQISISGNTYTIEVNCTTDNNKTVKAYYKGSVTLDGHNMD